MLQQVLHLYRSNKIRKSYGEKTIPVTNVDPENTMTKDDLAEAMGDPLYTEDSPRGQAYRDKIEDAGTRLILTNRLLHTYCVISGLICSNR